MDFNALLQPVSLIFLIPVLGIAAGIVGILTKHRERMAMIERGMHPDQPKIERARLKLTKLEQAGSAPSRYDETRR